MNSSASSSWDTVKEGERVPVYLSAPFLGTDTAHAGANRGVCPVSALPATGDMCLNNARLSIKRMIWLDSITDSMDMHLSKLPEIVKDRGAWHAAVHGVTKIRHALAIGQQRY